MGLETSLEAEIFVSNLYIFFVGEKKKKRHFGMNFSFFYAITCLFGEKK